MTPSELRRRVTLDTCAAAAALAAPAAWIGGAPAGLGVLAGGVLAIVNFRWLAARAAAVTAAPSAPAGSGAASAWLVMIILATVAFVASRNLQLVPRGAQNVLEVVLEQFNQMIDDVMGHEGRRYLPLLATLGLFILTGNLMSLVPGLAGPTGNLNTTAACALVVFVAYHAIGARKQGVLAYLKHFAGPVPLPLKPLMFVIELISHLARPLSL